MRYEIWETMGSKVIIRQCDKEGETFFEAETADDQDIADKINEAASALAALGVSQRSMLRIISKALSLSPRFRLVYY